jgi:hypothetical protein
MLILDAGYRLFQITHFSVPSGCRFFFCVSEFDNEGTSLKEAMTHRSWLETTTNDPFDYGAG